jgi:hypothetical protein
MMLPQLSFVGVFFAGEGDRGKRFDEEVLSK